MKKEEKIIAFANEKKTADERIDGMMEGAENAGVELSNPIKLEDIETLTRDQWLDLRKQGFGGSDAGTVMGLNSWNDFQNLFYDKKGLLQSPPVDFKSQARLDAGHQMEPVIANIFAGFTHFTVFKDSNMYRHSAYPFMLADCDFFAYDDQGMQVGVECKYINPEDLKYKWSSGVYGADAKVGNLSYLIQCRHYMAVMNLDRWYLCVWAGNNADDICIIRIDRDFDAEREMIIAEDKAWQQIQADSEPVALVKTSQAMEKMVYTLKNQTLETTEGYKEVDKDPDFINDVIVPYAEVKDQQKALKDQITELDKKKNELEVQIMQYLNDSGYNKITMGYDETDNIVVEYGERNARSFDYKGLKASDPDTYNYLEGNGFIKTNVSKPLKVAVKERKKINIE